MIYASAFVVLFTLVIGIAGLVLLAWAFRAGQLDKVNEQGWLALDERDRRLARPWESEADRSARERAYGPPVPPEAGEWGGHR